MNSTIKQLIEITKGKSQEEAMKIVDSFFAETVWSLEKLEWDGMSTVDRIAFVDAVRTMK